MSKLLQPFIFIGSLLLSCTPQYLHACGFDFTGSCATIVHLSKNNAPQQEYLVAACTYGTAFNGSLGTNLTNFQMRFASTRTWESCTNKAIKSQIYYRIYKDTANKGSYMIADLTQLTLFSSPPYRTKTYSDNLNIDLLAGLQGNTTYTLEIYYKLGIDTDENGTADTSLVSVPKTATFQTGNIAVSSFPVTIAQTNPKCAGASTGILTASTSGGRPPYRYHWSNGKDSARITGLLAGTYIVTVTDSTGAITTKSAILTAPAPVSATFNITNAGCQQSTGSVTATGIGGTAPYTFKWSNNATTATISNLAANIYSVTVTDTNRCTGIASATVGENCGGNGNYCSSNSNAPWSEWLANVKLNTINNTSEKSRTDRFAIGYSDWKDKSTALQKGFSYPLSISPGLSWSGYQSNLYYRVWIDFNKNGLFDDTEKVFEKNAVSLTVTGTVLVPTTALLGATTMRVSMKKGSYATACEVFDAGEVEDYTIIVQSATGNPCDADIAPPTIANCPANITILTAADSATATWTSPTATDNCTARPTLTVSKPSGSKFPLGTTTVTYTAKDSLQNTATCSFTVTVESSIVPACKRYTASNTNEICEGSWKPYGIRWKVGTQTQYLHAETVTFDKTDTTARLRGTFRTATWQAVQVSLNLSGGTATAPSGSPRTGSCTTAGTDYRYYTTVSGTVVVGTQTRNIARRGAAYQVGTSANVQNSGVYGFSGLFRLSDSTDGEFGLVLTATTAACSNTANLLANAPTILDFKAEKEGNGVHLYWLNNSAYRNDYFEIQKLGSDGSFQNLDFMNEKYADASLHDYHFIDKTLQEGDNYYRVKMVHLDGKYSYSAAQKITIAPEKKTVHIYPNPTDNDFNIEVKDYADKSLQISIFDIFGNMKGNYFFDKNHDNTLNFNTENWATGQYIIRISPEGKRPFVQKIVIAR